MLTCFDIAHYFLAQTDEDAGDTISNLKLQKLVYYAQGFYLALYNKPLFNEEIEAWTHGPVIPALYRVYKKYAANPIPVPTDLDFDVYSKEVKELLDEVFLVYGQYSGWKLRALTHEEPTWRDHYASVNKIISIAEMTVYFKTLINE